MEATKLEQYRKRMLMIPLAVGILLFALAFIYFKYESSRAENEHYKDLRAIGRLKTTQISSWYKERSLDAAYYSTSTTVLNEIAKYTLTGKMNRDRILERLSPIIEGEVYEEIIITDTKGNLLFSLDPGYTLKPSLIFRNLLYTVRTQKISTNNLFYCSYHKKVHNDIMAPLIIDKEVIAILIMRIDPKDFLYPYIQEWPVSGRTVETILAVREGDSAVFLNEMKKVHNTALRFKLPLTDTFVPAVAAVSGKKGRFNGRDYKGDPVLSDLSQIPGTTWSMVVKIDKSEVNEEVIYRTSMFTGIVVLLIAMITGILVLGYRRRQEIYLRLKDKANHEQFSQELNLLVDRRTRELQNMHDDLLNFSHIISHDLKEPVRKIKFLISLIKELSSDENKGDAKAYLDRIEISTNRLNELIDGIHNYTEVQDNQVGINEVDLNELLSKIISDLDMQIESKDAQVTVKTMPVIEGIEILLSKLFYNLLENALKFTRHDTRPVIEVDYRNIIRDGGEYVEITVTDNGIGFDERYSSRIFEPFKRLHTKDTFEGAGLGLAICRKIVERHNGEIYARGICDTGSSFHVILPVKQNRIHPDPEITSHERLITRD